MEGVITVSNMHCVGGKFLFFYTYLCDPVQLRFE